MANNTLLASDNFASGSLAVGWAAIHTTTVPQVIAGSPNVVEPTATSALNGIQQTGTTWPNDQVSEVTINSVSVESGTYLQLWVRGQAGAYSGYKASFNNGALGIFRTDAGVDVTLLAPAAVSIPAGSVVTFSVAGSVLNAYVNGLRVGWAADATYASGSPGFLLYTTVNTAHLQVASWRGYSAVQQDGIWQKQGIVIPYPKRRRGVKRIRNLSTFHSRRR